MSDLRRGRPQPVFDEGQETPFVWAHRGASALAPENTIRAFLLAAELGAPGIELDVQLTRDGIPVVLHDPWLWLDGSGELVLRPSAEEAASMRRHPVSEALWEDLEGRPVTYPDGSGEVLPRFEQVVEAVPAWVWLDVELKSGWGYDPRLAGVVAKVLAGRPERVLASSFDHLILQELAGLAPWLSLLAICHARLADLAGALAAIPAKMASIDRPFLLREDVMRWHDQGLEISIGGKELVEDLANVLRWPVAGVFLDDPRLVQGTRVGQER